MKCANCARDNPTGARYCVHCGAEQSVPTPIAAVAAAAMASRGRGAMPQAANAAHADPPPDESASRSQGSTVPNVMTSRSEAPSKARVIDPRIPASPAAQSAAPAYASAPKRVGLAFSIVVACFVAAAATFFAWRMFAPDAFVNATAPADEGSSVMSALPPPTSGAGQNRSPDVDTKADGSARTPESARSPAPVAPADNSAGEPPFQDANARPPADANGAAVNAPASPEPVQITPLPAKPAPRPPKKFPSEREPQKQMAAVPAAPVAPAASTPAATAPPTTQAAASPRTMAVPDPWARMREELATCTREDFITRVICGQRVRFRYCANYWGKVPECPGNPAPEHGQ